MSAEQLAIAAILFLAALAIGWFLGSRQAAVYRKERDDRLEEFRNAIADLAAAEERARHVPDLQAKLEEMRRECGDARAECARLSSAQEEKERAFELRLKELRE